jgi:hypothetical protein
MLTKKKTDRSVRRKTPTKALSKDCRCLCASVCLIEGEDEIARGQSKRYTATGEVAKNDGCKPQSCELSDVDWAVASYAGVTVVKQNDKSGRVTVTQAASVGVFQLTATMRYSCRCKGNDQAVVCGNYSNTVGIKVK